LFICALLGVGAMTFSNDANKYVLTPIERMIANVEKIRNNPLAAMSIGDQETHKREMHMKSHLARRSDKHSEQDIQAVRQSVQNQTWINKKRKAIIHWFKNFRERRKESGSGQPEPMETVVLEKTIIKIGSLLALGFGEAGAKIIAQNMRGGDNAVLNAIVPGRHVQAVFGICNVRHFTDATEVLQEQVMIFVNRVAGIVHSTINEFFGSPNHNVGDAFLLAWRLSGLRPEKQTKLADMSVLALAKLVAQINKSPLLAEYRSHPKLAKRLPNYRVRLGLSLHSGWAIEGAIGSEFKIDASYLSPNINTATRLEQATKYYGVQVVIANTVHNLLSDRVAAECRQIDCVTITDEEGLFTIYTLDLDDLAMEVSRFFGVLSAKEKGKYRLEIRRKKAERWSDDYIMGGLFERDPDIAKLREKYTIEFFGRFRMGYLNFEAGEWEVARRILEETRHLLITEDGPSAAHIRFIDLHRGKAPPDWPGHHPLPTPK